MINKFLTLIILTLSFTTYQAQTAWTTRTSASDNIWYGIAYGNGIYVAVSANGTGNRVMTSPDGITWTSRTSAADNTWFDVTYGNGLFVAISITGTGNRVMTSPDGINWTSRTSAADNNWYSVTYGNGLFVAVANTGTNRVMTSPDGITWTLRDASVNNNWLAVTYGNGLFVAISNSGVGNRVMTSPDGITWTTRASSADLTWYAVGYGNGVYVALSYGGGAIMRSTDGITWTSIAVSSNNWRAITYGNGVFVTVSNSGTNRVMTSIDGTSWTEYTASTSNAWSDVAYGNGVFVAIANSGMGNRVMTSEPPVVTTTTASSISTTSASSGGNVTSEGASSVTARGLCWSTSSTPTIANSITSDGIGAGTYTSSLTEMTSGTTYYYRAYATNSNGTAYGTILSFTTTSVSTPTISTSTISSFAVETASAGGNITSDGGASVTARGVCWSTNSNPTIADSKTTDGSGTGTFTSTLTGLTANTVYHYRAYATNSAGTSYGEDLRFISKSNTACPVYIETFDSDNGNRVEEDGWTHYNRDYFEIVFSMASGSNESDIVRVNEYSTDYYARSTNRYRNYEYYDDENQHKFLRNSPFIMKKINLDVTEAPSTGLYLRAFGPTDIYIAVEVDLKSDGLYGTGTNTITVSGDAENKTITFGAGWFGITEFQFYYQTFSPVDIKINSIEFSECLNSSSAPTVTTTIATSVLTATAIIGGNIESDGGDEITELGVCWSTEPNPTTNNNIGICSYSPEGYSYEISNLDISTTYYYRAYAINTNGTSYGEELTFTTMSPLPTVTTTTASDISLNTASAGGNVTNQGEAGVTSRGVCWSVNENPTIFDSKTIDGTGSGSFTSSLDGLTPGTTYHYRSYATSLYGTSYGSDLTFTTDVYTGPSTYSSTVTGSWTTAGTWVSNAVPTSSDNAQINNGHNVTISANTTIDNLILKSGGTITVTGTAVLTIEGDLQDEGGSFSIASGAQVLLKGNVINSSAAIKITNTSTNGMVIKGNVDVEQ